MRPIDADALIEKCGDWYVEEGTESGFIGTLKNLLATEPTIQPVATDINDSDVISRQAALDVIFPYCPDDDGTCSKNGDDIRNLLDDIENLPSAQPEIIACGQGELVQDGLRLAQDCVDRQAAIDALEKVSELFPYRVPGNRDSYDQYNEAWNDAIGRAEIEIEALPSAQPEQRWIPCSERLPEEDGGLYLVTDYSKSIDRKRMHISRCYMNKLGFWSDVPIGYEVVAWMPLPELYREETE